ncbi:phage portal protein [Dongia sp.]|uniref:phage portal protein n=1 Tax=Dongia sp. TaxID=1977262 RepID=UPI0035B0BA3A
MKWPWQRSESRAAVLTQKDLRLIELFDGDLDANFGQRVNAMRTEWLSAAAAAIDAIAGTICSLPAYVYRVTDAGREEDPGHPLARLTVDGFNDNLSWPDGVQWLGAECLRYGNAALEKIPAAGAVRELVPLPWPCLVPKILASGRMVYEYTDPITGLRRRLLDTDVLHLRDRTDNGLIGRARSERASPVIGAALALSEYSGNLFKNGSYPSGVVTIDGKVTAETLDRLKNEFKQLYGGPKKSGTAMILPNAKWDSVGGSPADQEILDARRFAVEEAARLYGVPGPIINDQSHSTFTNSETLIRFFAQGTISTWCRKIEATFMRGIFSTAERRTHRFEIDLTGLLRGDPETRWKSNQIAVDSGILTPNEIREQEGWNPRPDGDALKTKAATADKAGNNEVVL